MPRAVLTPGRGTLTLRAWPDEALPTEVVYDIYPPVVFDLDPAPATTELFPSAYPAMSSTARLDFIREGLVHWRDLLGRTFDFSVNPVEGYVDGSIYIASEHHYADLTRLAVTGCHGAILAAVVDITFDFEAVDFAPAPIAKQPMSVRWPVELAVDEIAFEQRWARTLYLRLGNCGS